jgi:hypothetical protein
MGHGGFSVRIAEQAKKPEFQIFDPIPDIFFQIKHIHSVISSVFCIFAIHFYKMRAWED